MLQQRVALLFRGKRLIQYHCKKLLYLNRQIKILFFILLVSATCFGQQMRFSIATDLGVQRSLKKEQQFWSVGHTVHAIINLAPKDAVYVWFAYYTNGNFRNNLTATAKDVLTIPQEIDYINRSQIRFKHFSIGYKKYLIGACDIEKGWNLYATAGFGLIPGRVTNIHTVIIDTVTYNVPVQSGRANFKRLTADLSLGYEKPIGADFYLYGEGRVWIPASDYPSKHLFVNNNAPLTAMLNVGLRILF